MVLQTKGTWCGPEKMGPVWGWFSRVSRSRVLSRPRRSSRSSRRFLPSSRPVTRPTRSPCFSSNTSVTSSPLRRTRRSSWSCRAASTRTRASPPLTWSARPESTSISTRSRSSSSSANAGTGTAAKATITRASAGRRNIDIDSPPQASPANGGTLHPPPKARRTTATLAPDRPPGPLAQLGERRLDKPEVTGSSPVRPTYRGPLTERVSSFTGSSAAAESGASECSLVTKPPSTSALSRSFRPLCGASREEVPARPGPRAPALHGKQSGAHHRHGCRSSRKAIVSRP